MSTNTKQIATLAELERLGIKWISVGNNEVKVLCPAHEEKEPSCSLNTDSNLWICYACKAKGDIVSMLALYSGVPRKLMILELSKRYPLEDEKEIDLDAVERHHARIVDAGPLLNELTKRGVTAEMIRDARLGFYDGRITIPVFDAMGRCLNIRRYLPGAPGPEKMRNTTGFGKTRLYMLPTLEKSSRVWICGGELKALVAYHTLERTVAAVAPTSGEGNWNSDWNPLFQGKDVFVCMDIDRAGVNAANTIAAQLIPFAKTVKIISLPLDKQKYPKGDLNDYVGLEKAGKAELEAAMASARPFTVQVQERIKARADEAPVRVRLAQAVEGRTVGRRIELEAVVTAVDQTPYVIPREVKISCSRDQGGCVVCPVTALTPDEVGACVLEVSSTSPQVLEMIGAAKRDQKQVLREALGIPSCKVVNFATLSHHTVVDARLSPQLEIGEGDSDGGMQPAYIVRSGIEMNVPYLLGGYNYPSPKTQQSIMLLDRAQETEDSLASFKPSEKELRELKLFQVNAPGDEALEAKLSELHEDLSRNVTRIYGRRDMHELMDMTYHSVLAMRFNGQVVNGWINSAVVGDTAQGKSEASSRLREHYRLGERTECKNATVAGLLGGLQQVGNRWFVSWGVIPRHDRRLVILEEVKGAPIEVLSKLTDMRSSGIAEIPKIERRKTMARTRLLFLSNPRGSRPMSSFGFGVEALLELIGSLEDIRRFDIALIVAERALRPEQMRPTSNPPIHRFTSQLCRRLILWAWTRGLDEITISVPEEIETQAAYLCSRFSEGIPLVDKGTIRHKLLRLAAAIAARVYSSPDLCSLVVLPEHIRYAAKFIERVYADPFFGYADFSRAKEQITKMVDDKDVQRYIVATRHPKDLVRQMLYRNQISLQDIQDWCSVDQDEGQKILSFLVRKHALARGAKRDYYKTPDFIALLKRMENDPSIAESAKADPRDKF